MAKLSLLSYPCLQAVLVHFEVNHRILVAQKLPSISSAEKTVPLKTRNSEITLKSHSTEINFLKYSLQVVRYDPEKKKVKSFKSCTNTGIICDLDTKGNPIPGPPLGPGDFDFGGKEKMEKFSDSVRLDFYVRENGRMIRMRKEYQYFLKFSVQKTSKKGTYEYIKYDQNFHIAMKYLNSKLFAGRPPISIGTLTIEPEKYLRLPADLKFEKCHLKVENIHTGLESLRPLLTPSSFPINYVCTDRITVADHEFLKGVKTLRIENDDQEEFPPLPCKQVRFQHGIDDEELLKIFMDFKSGKREIGTQCEFGFEVKREWKMTMDFLMKLEGAELGQVPEIRNTTLPHCVIFNINDTSEINIYCTIEEWGSKDDPENLDDYDDDVSYYMQMKIEPKGFATRIKKSS